MPFQTGGAGVTTLSDLQIDVDKDWKAHDIRYLGDLTPKVDGAYNIGGPNTQFDTVYANAGPPPGADSIGKEELKTGVVDTSYLTDNAATTAKVDPSVDLEFVRSNDNVVAGDIDAKVDGAYNLGSSANKFNTAYATSFPAPSTLIYKTKSGVADTIYGAATDGVPAAFFQNAWGVGFTADIAYQSELQPVKAASIFDHSNLGVSRAADIAYQSELQPVKFADVFDHANLDSANAKDIVYHGNFNLPSTEARDKVAESTYGVAKDITGVKGFTYQLNEKRDFAFRTETPNHAYWHRMYNTPAAFETVYQDYTTSMQKKGTTPDKSAPSTADPNPQPGACWSVSMVPDGTQVGGFVAPGPGPRGLGWDGTYLWYADNTADYIYQLKTDGTQVGGFASPGPDPRDVPWDGAYLWNIDNNALFIYHLKTDGTQIGDGFATPASDPSGLAWDGTYLWHADFSASFIYQLKTDGTTTGGGFATPTADPAGLAWDGTYLWYSEWDLGLVYQMATDGTQVKAFDQPSPGPQAGAWDGAYLWNVDDGAHFVYRLGNARNFDVNYRIFAK